MTFLNRLRQFVVTNQLFDTGDKLVLAVSGGVDSVVLAHLMQKYGVDFCIAHCNFSLRGEESDSDEAFVHQLALSLGKPFFVKQFDTNNLAKERGISVQMVAREIRYTWFEEIRKQNRYTYIATGHHQNDMLETVLLNLVRGTGLAGFHGILPKKENIIRPLLFATRQEVENYATENRLDWRDDSSNASNKYARNLIRNEVIPLLKKLNPSIESTIQRTVEKVSMAESQLRSAANDKKKHLVFWDKKVAYLEINSILEEPDPLYALSSILEDFGFELEIVKQVLDSVGSISGKVFYSPTHCLLKDRAYWFVKSNDRGGFKTSTIYSSTTKKYLPEGKYIKMKVVDGGKEMVEDLKMQGTMFFDFDKLKFPITLRLWKKGDVFSPYGMDGTKKLSDFLVDKKLNLFEKENVTVLENETGILAVVGHRVANTCLVDDHTKRIWMVKLNLPR